jgi:hypothetical protein
MLRKLSVPQFAVGGKIGLEGSTPTARTMDKAQRLR